MQTHSARREPTKPTYEADHGQIPGGGNSRLERARVLRPDERQRSVQVVIGHAADGLGRVALAVRQHVVDVVPGRAQPRVHVLASCNT